MVYKYYELFIRYYEQVLLSLLFVGADVAQGVGYSTKITHIELVEMAEHRKKLEKMTKPVLDTLRSYQDLHLVCHKHGVMHRDLKPDRWQSVLHGS
ncbi:hypothetical protein Bca52824_029629 [Brassica carinata]|uniref:Uncharacterized protein n=1 Tax=Brassica carinata TaxID=52824 RepID=A0A8X7VEP7_BRACI|nr:hypothetical protein Bca52824_029629 [Brassica carinata]